MLNLCRLNHLKVEVNKLYFLEETSFFKREVKSRCYSLFLSVAAAFDIFSIGFDLLKARVLKIEKEGSHHKINCIRDRVFPLFYGSVLGVIHPFLGVMATEPALKHVSLGYLLVDSLTRYSYLFVSCSPVRTYQVLRNSCFYKKFIDQCQVDDFIPNLIDAEKSFEKVQALDLFHSSITKTVYKRIFAIFQRSRYQNLFQRVSMVAFPLFSLLDLLGDLAFLFFVLSVGGVRKLGGSVPIYFEVTDSKSFYFLQLFFIKKRLIAMIRATFIALLSPKEALKVFDYSTQNFINDCQRKVIAQALDKVEQLKKGKLIVLPIVFSLSEETQSFLENIPSVHSHMFYAIVKKEAKKYRLYLVDKTILFFKKNNLSYEELCQELKQLFYLRFEKGKIPKVLSKAFSESSSLSLESTNCVAFNLICVLKVIYCERFGSFKELKIEQFKKEISVLYSYYKDDFLFLKKINRVFNYYINLS